MITTIGDFIVQVCQLGEKNVSNAYNLFEDLCSDELRDKIYSFADPTSPEPFRSAMHRLGFVNY